ncbi:MAG TPA: hypothetical protein VHB69_07350 [Mycobacteriales bacterium]|nr:hypothetical protein [Mycobacteriales bacterium]
MTSAPGDAADRLRRALAPSVLPARVQQAAQTAPPDPQPGQLWRARWEETSELVAVLRVTTDAVEAAPVTLDVEYADNDAAVVPAGESPLGVDTVTWIGLRRVLPMTVLDRFLGEWPVKSLMAGTGSVIVNPADPRAEYRAYLEDELDLLAAARWAPTGAGTLAEELRAAGIDPQRLVALLDLAPQEALALLRGRLPVTAEQAETLAPALNRTVEQILAANPAPPAEIVSLLDRPRRRPQVQALARRRGMSEVTARQTAAFGVWRLAARQVGDRTEPAWDARLERYFHVTLNG